MHIYSLTLADIDSAKRMTPGAVLCYFQDTIARFLAENRVGAFDLMEDGITWMIAEFHSSFSHLPVWPGIVQMEVFVSELASVKVYVDYLVRDIRGRIVASGESTWLMVDVRSRRMLPSSTVPRLTALYDERNHVAHQRHAFRPAAGPEETAAASTHTVSAAETDFNGHMSNRDYVRLAMSLVQPLIPDGTAIRELHVKFMQECHSGEILHCRVSQNGPQIIVTLLRDGGYPVCVINTCWDTEAGG